VDSTGRLDRPVVKVWVLAEQRQARGHGQQLIAGLQLFRREARLEEGADGGDGFCGVVEEGWQLWEARNGTSGRTI
jgi:hypothetical protein